MLCAGFDNILLLSQTFTAMTAVSITTIRRTGILEKLIQQGRPFEISIRGEAVCMVTPKTKSAPKRVVMRLDDKSKIPIPSDYDPDKAVPELNEISPVRTGFSTRQRLHSNRLQLSD